MQTLEPQATERRRDRRYPFGVRTILSHGGKETSTRTDDVSFTGVFVETDAPLPERQLLQIRFTLPPEGDELAVLGMVTRRFPRKDGRAPGVGLQFYALSAPQRERWKRFIRFVAAAPAAASQVAAPQVAASQPAAPQPTAPRAAVDAPAPAPAPAAVLAAAEPIRRDHPRHAVRLDVILRTERDLLTLFTTNISRGGMFVGTEIDLPTGTPLRLSLVHPATGEHFPLDAVVRWRGAAPLPGLGVEFTGLDEQRRDDLFQFICSEIPVETVEYVAAGDRRLASSGPDGGGE